MLPPLNKPYEDSSFAETPAITLVAGSRITRLPFRYERNMLFLQSPANCFVKELSKIVLGVFIEYFVHPTNKVYHGLTPQPRSFLRDLPYSRGVVSYTLHQSVLIIDKLTNS